MEKYIAPTPASPEPASPENALQVIIREHKRLLVENENGKRILMEDACPYSRESYARDKGILADIEKKIGPENKTEPSMGKIGEALVFSRFEKGILGKGITARPASRFDDIFKGTDIVLDQMGMTDPMAASIDVTLNQRVEGGHHIAESNGLEDKKDGLLKKLERIRERLDHISSMSPPEARTLLAWVTGGGMSEKFSRENAHLYKVVEKIIMLKYYDAPEGHPLHGKPRPIIAGPQFVLALSDTLVNRAITDPLRVKEHEGKIDALIVTETIISLRAYIQYVESLIKNRGANAILEQIWVACRAWEQVLSRNESKERVLKSEHAVRQDTELLAQASAFQEAIKKVFTKK